MNAFNCSVHFLTLKQIGYEESNVAVNFYHDRTHFDQTQRNLYAQFTEEFNLQQGRHFVLHNRIATTPSKMSKLKDQVKEFDALFSSSTQDATNPNETTSSNKNKYNSSLTSSEINQQFMSCLNSNLSKIIWLSPTHILLIMQDSTLVWLIIDTLSGDLIKILIDKTLTSSFGSQNSKLSGSLVCDSALLVKETKSSPILILLYADKSKVDLITFSKAAQMSDYIKGMSKDQQRLEKLASFEPVLTSYEFSCPSIYKIEKRISLQQNNFSTFTVWWPNDGQTVWQSAKNETISLLERDDLRNNVLVLSTDLSDKNLMEYLFKSDGLLLALSYSDSNNLIAVEQTETNAQKYMITLYRYNLPNENESLAAQPAETLKASQNKSLKMKLTSFSLNSKIFSIEQVKLSKKSVIMLAMDQTLILYDIGRNMVNKFKIKNTDLNLYNGIEWIIEDLLFCVFNLNGQIKLFDIAFNEISLNYMTRYAIKFNSLSEYLNPNIFVPFGANHALNSNANRLVKLVSARSIFTDSLWSCFHYSKGPFGLFRLYLPEDFNCISLVNHYLKSSQLLDQAELNTSSSLFVNTTTTQAEANPNVYKFLASSLGLLSSLDWDEQASVCLSILSRILSFVFGERAGFDFRIEQLAEEVLGTFYKPKRALSEKTIYEYKHQVSRYARRYFYMLVKHSSLNRAFLLAVDIGSKDLFNDLYYCALDKHENQLAEVCRKKYQEILDEENQAKLRNDLNKSVTTIDDNIKGASTEFDKYSVSSSENETVDSDNDSFDSACEYEYLNAEQRYNLKAEKQLRLNKATFRAALKQNEQLKQPKVYTEEEIESFAKNVINENMFIYQLNLN